MVFNLTRCRFLAWLDIWWSELLLLLLIKSLIENDELLKLVGLVLFEFEDVDEDVDEADEYEADPFDNCLFVWIIVSFWFNLFGL